MRDKIIAGNWKMNLSLSDAIKLAEGIKLGLASKKTNRKVLVFPSTIHLSKVTEILANTQTKVGCQNIYPSGLAAFTGETSIDQLKDFSIDTVLIGHSERRLFLGESDEFLNRKVKFAIAQKFNPMLCIGETLEERESGKTFSVLKTQITQGLANLTPDEVSNLSLAYEPVWAIGTGKVATPAQAEEAHQFVRSEIKSIFGEKVSEKMPILYGGSVKPDNVTELLSQLNIDGGLVGGASQKVDSFLALI